MREAGSIHPIDEACKKPKKRHEQHIAEDNEQRLAGRHEWGHIHDFSAELWCVSIRILGRILEKGYGYMEVDSGKNLMCYV